MRADRLSGFCDSVKDFSVLGHGQGLSCYPGTITVAVSLQRDKTYLITESNAKAKWPQYL